MMWAEFEGLLGKSISASEWKTIECCYMHFDYLFADKQSVVKAYKSKGIEYFEGLAKPIFDLYKKMDNAIIKEREEKLALEKQVKELLVEKEKNKPNIQDMHQVLSDMFRTYYCRNDIEELAIIDNRGNEYSARNPIALMQKEIPMVTVEVIGMCVNKKRIVSLIRTN